MALDFVAGCIGGCAGLIVGHPFDTVKVHMQTQDFKNPQYKGLFDCIKSIVAKDSVRGLYRGISSPMTGVAFINGIVFGVYGNIQRLSSNPNSYMTHFWAGATAGLIQSVITSPMELVKTRLQLQNSQKSNIQFRNSLHCLSYIYRYDGLRGIFRGLGLTAMRDIPGFSSYFVSYEFLVRSHGDPSVFHILMAGGMAGAISWIFTIPIDVVKSRIQADGMNGGKLLYNGVADCVRKSYQLEGLSFFTRGLSSTMLRAFPMNAVCFLVVSSIINYSHNKKVTITVAKNMPRVVMKVNDNSYSRRRTLQGLLHIGTFSEAICSSEIIELAHDWYDLRDAEENSNTKCDFGSINFCNGCNTGNYLQLNLHRKLDLPTLDNNLTLLNE